MLTRTQASVAADTLLAQARAQCPAIARAPAMPRWYLDAPDGLDATGKKRRFDELQEQARKEADTAATGFVIGAVPLLMLSQHATGVRMLVCVLVVPLVVLVALTFLRKPLLKRLLRQHVKTTATY